MVSIMEAADFYFYEPGRGHGLPHDPFKAILGPRPIGWFSTVDSDGRVNLAPYSFYTAVCEAPPLLVFSSGGRKHSVRNIEATGEFVANFVTKDLAAVMNLTSIEVPAGVDEMAMAGLTPAPCRVVSVPRVVESPAALECKLVQIVQLPDVTGKLLEQYLVIAQVVGVHIANHYLVDGRFDTAAAQPILRAGYRGDYAEIGNMFETLRPSPQTANLSGV